MAFLFRGSLNKQHRQTTSTLLAVKGRQKQCIHLKGVRKLKVAPTFTADTLTEQCTVIPMESRVCGGERWKGEGGQPTLDDCSLPLLHSEMSKPRVLAEGRLDGLWERRKG